MSFILLDILYFLHNPLYFEEFKIGKISKKYQKISFSMHNASFFIKYKSSFFFLFFFGSIVFLVQLGLCIIALG